MGFSYWTPFPHFSSSGSKWYKLSKNYQIVLNCWDSIKQIKSNEKYRVSFKKMTNHLNYLENKALILKKDIDKMDSSKSAIMNKLTDSHSEVIANMVLLKFKIEKLKKQHKKSLTDLRSQFLESFIIFQKTCENCRELLEISNRVSSFTFVSTRSKKTELVSGKSIAFNNKYFWKFKNRYISSPDKKSEIGEFDRIVLALLAGCKGKLFLGIKREIAENY